MFNFTTNVFFKYELQNEFNSDVKKSMSLELSDPGVVVDCAQEPRNPRKEERMAVVNELARLATSVGLTAESVNQKVAADVK